MTKTLRRWWVLGAVGVTILSGGHRKDRPRTGLDDIRQQLGQIRPLEARITLDSQWAPCAAEPPRPVAGAEGSSGNLMRTEIPDRLCSPSSRMSSLELRDLAARVQRDHPSDASLVLATLPLLAGAGEERTTRAIEAFKDIEGQEALTDLSAAYLHLAEITDRPHLLLDSVEASTEVLQLRPEDHRALFNRALVLSRLHLATTAHRAWESYLEKAPADDGWTTEARGFQEQVTRGTYQQEWRAKLEPALRQASLAGNSAGLQAIVRSHRQLSREWGERDLLSEWANTRGAAEDQILATARRIGAALAEAQGDHMLLDSVEAIAASGRGTFRSAKLRAGHLALAIGYDDLYRHWRLERARGRFLEARDNLAGSPFALWADFYLGLIDYYQGNYERALISLESLQIGLDQARYPALAGRALWIQGLIAASNHRLETAADLYLRSLEIFSALGEEQNIAAMHALRGEVLSKLGRFDESWRHLYNALARVDHVFDPVRHHAILEVAILNAQRQGLYRAGLAFADEHLYVARRTDSAQILHYAFMHRASLRYALGDLQGARADLTEAARAVLGLEDPSLRQRSAADFDLISAEIHAEADPARAIPLLDKTIEQYEKTQYAYLLPQAYGARAQAYLRLGDLKKVEQDLARQIWIYEDSADETVQDLFRLSLLDQAVPAFDRMIGLQATKLNQPALALEYCERSRYRALLDASARASLDLDLDLPLREPAAQGKSFDSRRLQQQVPPDTAILEFALVEDHLLSWVITRSNITMVAQKVGQEEVRRQIRALHRELTLERPPAVRRDLYDLLLRPAEKLLGGASRLVIVPDKELSSLPFEVLIDRRTGRHLLEDLTVTYSPSATLHLRLRDKVARMRREPLQRIVSATGAQDGGTRYEHLPEAVPEAQWIATLYPQASFLPNPGKETFLDALSSSQLLHFSGHAIPNADQPFASRLVLADTRAESIELYAYELYDRSFLHLQLVTLSACGTADPATPTLGVAATLSGPFLAAGVPQVIGSQWRVADHPTRLFFAAFHRRLSKGVDAASALRATKLDFLRSDDPHLASPRTWGAFVLVGG